MKINVKHWINQTASYTIFVLYAIVMLCNIPVAQKDIVFFIRKVYRGK